MTIGQKLLPQFRGRLTPTDIAKGINAANCNARRLVADAEILLAAQRYPTATALAILSIEESGKVPILRAISVETDEKLLKEAWTAYRNHKLKNRMWVLPDLVLQGARYLLDFKEIINDQAEHPAILDAIKQICFYTDCYGNKNWSNPTNIIDDSLAKQLIKTAKIFCSFRDVTPREIELWVTIVGPVWRTDGMKDALLQWHQAMIKEGLTGHTQKEFESFVSGN